MRFGFIMFFSLLFCLPTWGQRYSFLQRGAEDGLTNPVINDIEMDVAGMVWLATDGGGLVRFDGIEFMTYSIFNQLPSPFVTVLEKDDSGAFWIGTERGLAKYDGIKITLFPNGPKSKINAIAIFPNYILVASKEGLYVLKEGVFRKHDALGNTDVLALSKTDNPLVFATEKGAFKDENGAIKALNFGQVQKIITLKNGLVFCQPNSAFCQFTDTSFTVEIPGIRDAVLAEDGGLWLASQRHGLIKIKGGYTEIIDASKGLAYSRVRCLLQEAGKIWVGSQQGLSFLQNTGQFALDASQGLQDESVHAALKVKGDYWLGTAAGVSVYRANGTIENYSQKDGLPGGIVLDLAVHKGVIWAAAEQGICYFKKGKFYALGKESGFDADFVFCIESMDIGLLVGTAGGAMQVLNGRAEHIPFTGNLPDGIVAIETQNENQAFIGISGSLYKSTLHGLEKVNKWHGMAIDTMRIFAIKTHENLGCLLVNDDGVYVWNGSKMTHITQKDGLASTTFKSAAFAGNRLWVTTEAGVQFLDVEENMTQATMHETAQFASINQRDFNNRSMRVVGKNEVLNGSNNGLLVTQNAGPKPFANYAVSIQQVNLFFEAETRWEEYAKSLTTWHNLPHDLHLSYDKNYLSFTFNVQPNVAHDTRYFIRYKLTGQDVNWTYANERREAFYTNISPGKFVFEVESSLNANFNQVEKSQFAFRIIPPFYKTIWFWVLVVIFIGGAVFFAVRYRINQLNQKLALETALADSERKALRLQMNPHFVFNALDAISGFIFKNEPKTAVRYLGNFAKLMRLTLESSRETLVPLQNEIQLLKNYIDLEQLRFNNKFKYNIHFEEEVDPYDALLPPMLLQPFVENAIIHGLKHKSGANGQLDIAFAEEGNHLICTITDNGVGRKKSAELNVSRHKQSLATSITEERIELLSKSLGERVSFTIEDLVEPNGEAAGTRVIISFPHLSAMD